MGRKYPVLGYTFKLKPVKLTQGMQDSGNVLAGSFNFGARPGIAP